MTGNWETVALSLEVASLAALLSLPLAIALAWLLSRRRFPGHRLLDVLVHAPLVLPPVVVGYLLLLVFGARGPVGHWLLTSFGIHLAFTTQGAILAAAVMSLPLMVRSMRLSLESIDEGIEIAARTLGASRLDVFCSITLPLMSPGIIAGCVVGMARALGEFGATITFAGNIEGETRTIPIAIYMATQSTEGDMAAIQLAAVSLTLAFIALFASGWIESHVRRVLGRGPEVRAP